MGMIRLKRSQLRGLIREAVTRSPDISAHLINDSAFGQAAMILAGFSPEKIDAGLGAYDAYHRDLERMRAQDPEGAWWELPEKVSPFWETSEYNEYMSGYSTKGMKPAKKKIRQALNALGYKKYQSHRGGVVWFHPDHWERRSSGFVPISVEASELLDEDGDFDWSEYGVNTGKELIGLLGLMG